MSLTQVQTAVAQVPVKGVPGQRYDQGAGDDIVSKVADEVIPFGVLVGFTADGHCELPDSSGEVTGIAGYGIALRDPGMPTESTGYQIGDVVPVITRGRVFVLAEETVVVTDTPFARFATGTGTQKGAFRNDADTATAATPANSRFFQGGGTTDPPVLELR